MAGGGRGRWVDGDREQLAARLPPGRSGRAMSVQPVRRNGDTHKCNKRFSRTVRWVRGPVDSEKAPLRFFCVSFPN